MMDDDKRLKGLDTCEFLVCSVLTFGMDHIKNLKLKYLRVIICYQFVSEKLKGSPNILELVEAVTDLFRKDWGVLVQIWGVVGCLS